MKPSRRRSRKYLEKAVEALHHLSRREAASEQLESLTYWMASVDPARTLELARSIPENHVEPRATALRWAVEALGRASLPAALAVLDEIPEGGAHWTALGQLVLDVSRRDPVAALALADQERPEFRESTRSFVLGPLAGQEPDLAIEEMGRLRKRRNRLRGAEWRGCRASRSRRRARRSALA